MAYKASKQRDMIMEYMQHIHGHVSAEKIFEDLNKEDQKISLATVYRNLNILSDMEEIKKIALHDGFVYDKTYKPHYHFYCHQCNTLYDLPQSYDEKLDIEMNAHSMVGDVEGHEITFKGVCKNCMEKRNKD